MGGVASGIGQAVGSVFGGLTGGIMDAGGLRNQFQAQAPDITMQPELLKQIQASYAGMSPVAAGQNQLAQALLAQSQGQGPNPAQMMMKQAQDRANMQGAGMLASAKGMSPAMAARMAGQNTAAGNQAVAQNAGILGAQQQVQAQQQLGGLYGQMGGQGLQQQQLLQQALANQNSARSGASLGAQGINAGIASSNTQMGGQLMGGLMGAAGSMGAAAIGAAHGGYIGGEAVVAGDSPANDTVPAMLSPGEIVVPRTAAKDADTAKAFIDQLMKSGSKKRKKA